MTERTGFGVIGCGVWGETHLKALSSHPAARLAGICDVDPDLLARRATAYEVGFSTGDYRELLARPDVAAVHIATPDHLHRQIAVAACEAGKHVLIEKPMATTVEDCQAMIAAADAAGVLLMVDFHNRFNPAFYKAKQAILAGRIGEPQMASITLSDSWWVPTEMWSWASRTTVAWFLAAHATDVARWLFDDEIVRVYSVSRRRVLKAMGADTPDFFHTILEFSRGGVAHLENSWILSDTHPTIFDFKFELQGDRGTIMADLSTHRMLQLFDRTGIEYPDMAVVVEVHGKPGGFGIEAIKHFVDCVALGAEPLISPQDGLRNTEVLCALHRSAETGQPVEL
jgi:predicted dehydrogenase